MYCQPKLEGDTVHFSINRLREGMSVEELSNNRRREDDDFNFTRAKEPNNSFHISRPRATDSFKSLVRHAVRKNSV